MKGRNLKIAHYDACIRKWAQLEQENEDLSTQATTLSEENLNESTVEAACIKGDPRKHRRLQLAKYFLPLPWLHSLYTFRYTIPTRTEYNPKIHFDNPTRRFGQSNLTPSSISTSQKASTFTRPLHVPVPYRQAYAVHFGPFHHTPTLINGQSIWTRMSLLVRGDAGQYPLPPLFVAANSVAISGL